MDTALIFFKIFPKKDRSGFEEGGGFIHKRVVPNNDNDFTPYRDSEHCYPRSKTM